MLWVFPELASVSSTNLSFDCIKIMSKIRISIISGFGLTLLFLSSSMEEIDSACRDAWNGLPSQRPVMEMTIPSSLDKTISPPGIMNLIFYFCLLLFFFFFFSFFLIFKKLKWFKGYCALINYSISISLFQRESHKWFP